MQEESEVKWLPLRLNIIPLLDKQARSVLDLYLATRKEILEGDILSIQKLIRIKEEVKARVKEIDSFYNKNTKDPRVRYIYASRTILQKISEKTDNFENMEESSMNENDWRVPQLAVNQDDNPPRTFNTARKTQRQLSSKKQQTNRILASNKLQTPARTVDYEHYKNEENLMRLSDIQTAKSKGRSPMKSVRYQQAKQPIKGSSRKIQQGPKKGTYTKTSGVSQLEREKAQMAGRLEQNPFNVSKSFKDLSELVFTIKMTKEEYNQFMRLKKKNNHA